jgi:cell division protein ZapA (FtsZ GTPase activity inhibitor)
LAAEALDELAEAAEEDAALPDVGCKFGVEVEMLLCRAPMIRSTRALTVATVN